MLAGTLAIELLVMICIGIAARKLQIVSGDFNKQLSSLLTKVLLPCLIVKSMYGMEYSLQELKNCGYLLGLALVFLAVEGLLGQIVYMATGKTSSSRILRFGILFTNFTFMGIPVVETLYGAHGVFYFVVFLIPIRIVYYASAKPLLSPPGMMEHRQSFSALLKNWLSPPVVAVFVGLLLYVTQLELPEVATYVISSIGSTCSPLGMLLCGISLGEYPFRKLLHLRYLRLTAARNLLLPGIFFLLTLPIDHQLGRIMVICAALPVATLSTAFCVQYDPDPESHFESAGSVLFSTLFSVVTIPLWAYLLQITA